MSASTASAAPLTFSRAIGVQGSAAGALLNPQDVAVNDTTGNVYVADTGNDRIDEFTSAGMFIAAWGEDVDQTTGGNICTAVSGDTCQAGSSSTSPGGFEYPVYVAVDNSAGPSAGDVYVGDMGDNLVTKFTASGDLVSGWGDGGSSCGTANGQLAGACATGGPFTSIEGITVDGSGNLDVYDGYAGNWFAFSQDGAADPTVAIGLDTPYGGNPSGIGVDSSGDLYLTDGYDSLYEFSATGSEIGDISLSNVDGVAVDPETNDVYANETDSQVADYSAADLSACVAADDCTPTDSFGSYYLSHAAGGTATAATDSAAGVAYDPATSEVYVADPADGSGRGQSPLSQVAVFGPGQAATNVSDSGVTLTAVIDPQGSDTTCQFEYGTGTAYGTTVPCSPADLGSGNGAVSASAALSGLPAGTEFHWRVVTTSALDGMVDGPDHTFTTNVAPTPQATSAGCPNAGLRAGSSADLPDCRAYEQVSPVDKNGTSVKGAGFGKDFSEAASDGNAMTFWSESGIPGGSGTQEFPIYEASRSSEGWSTQGLLPPAKDGNAAEVLGWSSDLAWSMSYADDTIGGSGALYLRDDATGTVTPIAFGSGSDVSWSVGEGGIAEGGSQVVFNSGDADTPNAVSGSNNTYAWNATTGALSLVSVLPDGSAATGDAGGPVSSDGSAAFFTAVADTGTDNGTSQIFLRTDPTAPDASTVQVSLSQKTNGTGPGGTDPSGPESPTGLQTTPSGSEAVFMSEEELTNSADTGSADQGNDLYEYNAASGTLTDLSVPDPGTSNPDAYGAQVLGTLGVSDDGSYVYFAAQGVLAPGASQGDCGSSLSGVYGACNLYMWHGGTVTFLAQLLAGPSVDGARTAWDTLDWSGGNNTVGEGTPARVSSDGQTLLFSSAAPLTGYDNTSLDCGTDQGVPGLAIACPELYVYKAGSGNLECVSCDPSGAAPLGRAQETPPIPPQDNSGEALSVPFWTRNLSENGDRVFFDSPDPLLPQDQNGQLDVYEWEADGTGSCQSAADSGGCLYSISTGDSTQPEYFADASSSGDDAFFFTYSQLVSQDQDQLEDVYDARVDGGLASQNPPPVPAPCQAEACKPPPSSTPPTPPPTPVSVTFTGPGDQSSPDTATVKVSRRAVVGQSFYLRVTVPAAGRITASGGYVRGKSRAAARAGTYRLKLRLTKPAVSRLRHRHRLQLTIRVGFEPSAGAAASAVVTMTIKERAR